MLKEKIISKSIKVGILGLGYVGLPLALLCAEKGFKSVGIDIDERKINAINEGKSYISEINDSKLQAACKSRGLMASTDLTHMCEYDIIIVCVPTPLSEGIRPDYSFLMNGLKAIAKTLRKEQLVIIESTMVPQTTRNDALPTLETTGLKVGEDFYLAFSPERIDPGNMKYQLGTIPKLVSGITEKCRELAELFYNLLDIKTFPVQSTEVAEMAKILENTYRDVNIALINEMAIICGENGLNIWDVIAAASSKPFGFQAFYPGPGVGGHCIPKDSFFYTYWAKTKGSGAALVERARKINDNMPRYIVKRIEGLLSGKDRSIKGSRILVLGITYKKDVNDIRESAPIKIMEILKEKEALLSYHDPYIKQVNIGEKLLESSNFEEIDKVRYDCILLAVAHNHYKEYNGYNSDIVFDLTNTISRDIPGLYHL